MRLAQGRRLALTLTALGLVVAGCGGGSGGALQITSTSLGVTGGHATVGDLSITRAYIPAPATPSLAAAYFTVTNSGPGDRLESVQTSDFRSATVHHYATTANGLEQMIAAPTGAVVPAHGQLVLSPGSYHLMLQRPSRPLHKGMVEQLTLRFADAGSVTLAVPVVAATGLPGSASTAEDQMPGMSMPGTSSIGAAVARGGPLSAVWLPRLAVGRLFSTWSFHVWSALAAAILLLAYLLAWRSARRRGTDWRRRSVLLWCSGIAVLVFTTQGSLRVYDDSLFWVHMVGHLLLVMVVPVLLVAGRPLDLAIAALPESRAQRFQNALHGRICSVVTNPGLGLALYTAVIVGTHLTGFMNQMMIHPWLGGIEQLMYVGAGVLFFLPLIGNAPIRWQLSAPLRMAMLVVAMPIDTFTGVVLGQTNKYPWPMMAAMHPPWAPSLTTDLHAGGAIMWVGGDAIMAVMFGIAAVGWARSAMSGTTSDLGGWLDSARANYQQDLAGGRAEGAAPPADPDSDEALEAYNEYLQRVNGRHS